MPHTQWILALAILAPSAIHADTEVTDEAVTPTVTDERGSPEQRRGRGEGQRTARAGSDVDRAERRERWRNLSDEQRAAIRERRRERGGECPGRRSGGPNRAN